MKTELLKIRLHHSRIGIIILFVVNFSLLTLISLSKNIIYFSNYVSFIIIFGILFINYLAFKYLSYSKIKQIDILTHDNKIILWKDSQAHHAELIGIKQISFWLIILYLKTNKTTFLIPIFIDSTFISQYKRLKIFLLSYKKFK